MNQWKNLVQARMIKKVGDVYTVDFTDIILVSNYNQFTENSQNAIDMVPDFDATIIIVVDIGYLKKN